MGTRSVIASLPGDQKASVDQLIRASGYAGIARLLEEVSGMGVATSRAALARYIKALREHDQRFAGPTLVLVLESKTGAVTLVPTHLTGTEVIDALPDARRTAIRLPPVRRRTAPAAPDT